MRWLVRTHLITGFLLMDMQPTTNSSRKLHGRYVHVGCCGNWICTDRKQTWVGVLYLGLGPSLACYLMQFFLLREAGASKFPTNLSLLFLMVLCSETNCGGLRHSYHRNGGGRVVCRRLGMLRQRRCSDCEY